MSKTATIRQRRTLRDGKHLVQVVCPVCDSRHWLPATDTTGDCPRRPGRFAIIHDNRSVRTRRKPKVVSS